MRSNKTHSTKANAAKAQVERQGRDWRQIAFPLTEGVHEGLGAVKSNP